MNATFIVYFEDLNYEGWTGAHCVKTLSLEPRNDGLFDLNVRGTKENIDRFAAELGWGPER